MRSGFSSPSLFTIEQLRHLLVQDLRSFLKDDFCHQGGAGAHCVHGDWAGWRGFPLQQVVINHLHHCPLQVAVRTATQGAN